MKKYRVEFAVGLFVLVGLICLAYMTVKLGKMEVFSDKGYTVSARFASITGLRVGAAVEVAGVPVGKVSSIELGENHKADVTLLLDSDVHLTKDSIASIKTSGIIGDKYVSISLGSGAVLGAGEELKGTEPAVDLESLISQLGFGGSQIFTGDGYTVSAVFSSVAGLREGAMVELAGVPVGKVLSITLDKNYHALVNMVVTPNVELTDDTIASVKTRGIIGDKYVNISLGGGTPLKAGDTLTDTESAIDIEALISKYVFGGVK